MITAQEYILLDIIDSIEDKNQQRNLIEKVLAASKEKRLEPKKEALVYPSYSMTDVFDRVKKDKPFSIQDLKAEINSLKTEV